MANFALIKESIVIAVIVIDNEVITNNGIEIESVTKLISKPLKERLKYDAINLNFMKKISKAKLPL